MVRSWNFILSVMESQKNLWDIEFGDVFFYQNFFCFCLFLGVEREKNGGVFFGIKDWKKNIVLYKWSSYCGIVYNFY